MKINIDITLEVNDEDLVRIADVADGKESKRKAKRVEAKEYIWSHGRGWATDLDEDHAALFGESGDDLEDLI